MDSATEGLFLSLVESRKNVILSKDNTSAFKEMKRISWECVRKELLTQTGKDFSTLQLQKKWQNIQSRIKEKMNYSRGTGGGPIERMSENDNAAYQIIGVDNPKLAMVPGALENANSITKQPLHLYTPSKSIASTSYASLSASDEQMPTPAKRYRSATEDKESIEALHRSVLVLQREKLKLKIQLMKKKVCEHRDAEVQTDDPSILLPSFTFMNYLRS
jgi:hypothetical protein